MVIVKAEDVIVIVPNVGSIINKFPEDYIKRYTDPEIWFLGAALASRAITDLVIGRKTISQDLNIFN